MPSLSNYSATKPVKVLIAGRPGVGKTSLLAYLAKAGYNLAIIDTDNNLRPLAAMLTDDPEAMARVHYETVTEKRKASPLGAFTVGNPSGFPRVLQLLTKWKTDDEELGDPAAFGLGWIVVIDSGSRLSDMALEWTTKLANGNVMLPAQQHWLLAQRQMEALIQLLNSDEFGTNVLWLTHVKETEQKGPDGAVLAGSQKELPMGVGTSGSEKLGSFFDTILLADRQGSGDSIKRFLWTRPSGLLETKFPAFAKSERRYEMSQIVEIFKLLGSTPPKG